MFSSKYLQNEMYSTRPDQENRSSNFKHKKNKTELIKYCTETRNKKIKKHLKGIEKCFCLKRLRWFWGMDTRPPVLHSSLTQRLFGYILHSIYTETHDSTHNKAAPASLPPFQCLSSNHSTARMCFLYHFSLDRPLGTN